MTLSILLPLALILSNPAPLEKFPAAHPDSIQRDVESLSSMRTRIDTLSYQLRQVRNRAQHQEQALASKIAHIQMQVRQEKIRHATLLQKRQALLSETRNIDARRTALLQPATDVLKHLKHHVELTLPYNHQARLQTLTRIEAALTSPDPEPVTALARLFEFIEDERTLNRELGIAQQVIHLNGTNLLVDVAHVGMAALYFKTADDRFGWAVPTGSSYRFEVFSDPDHTEAARTLFATLNDNQRTGYFNLPLTFPKGERS